jgi:UDP-perosamine 4-acetyltransferase
VKDSLDSPRIAIFGVGDHAHVVADILRVCNEIQLVSCFVDLIPKEKAIESILGIPVCASVEEFLSSRKPPDEFIIAVGFIALRPALFMRLVASGFQPRTVRHPHTVVSMTAQIGRGTTICPGAVIGVEASIGDDVIVNTAASIDHNCVIGNHVNLSPGVTLAGRVRVGDRTFFGTGAKVINNIAIGEDCVIGAGAVVIEDVAAGTTVIGVPAKPRTRR